MLKALILSRLQSLLYSIGKKAQSKRKSGPGTKILIAILAVYVVGCFAMMFGMLFSSLCAPLCSAKLNWLYFAIVLILVTALGFVGSVFTTQSQLYDARDNEMLLSMPIPPKYILASRMIMLYALNLGFELLIAIPAAVVYISGQPVSALGVIIAVVLLILLPLLPLTLSCIIGWLVALISSRMRNKSIAAVAFSVIFLLAYLYFYSNISGYINALVANSREIGQTLRSAIYPIFCFGDAIVSQNPLSVLVALALLVLPFAVIYAVLSISFIHIATAKRGAARKKYVRKELKVASPIGAMIKKELRHFAGCTAYIINCSFGTIMLIIGSVALIVQQGMIKSEILPILPDGFVTPLLIAAICFLGSTNIVTAPSVSLEGKNIWVIKSMPVAAKSVLMSKLYTGLIITLPPVLIASVVSIAVMMPGLLESILLLVTPIAFSVCVSFVGLSLNIRFPKLDWISETVAVKQSLSATLSVLVTMVLSMLVIPALLSFISTLLYLLLYTLLLCVISALLYVYLCRTGARRFEEL